MNRTRFTKMTKPWRCLLVGLAFAALLVYLLMAGVLAWRPQGLFAAQAT